MGKKKSCCCPVSFKKHDDESDDDSICEIEKNFLERTSCHGVSYWCDSINIVQKIAWIILVLGMTGVLIYQIYLRLEAYFKYEASNSVQRNFVDQIDFPAVTLCNYNRYFAADNTKLEVPIFQFLNRITSPLFIAFASKVGISVPITLLGQIAAKPGFSISNELDVKGYQLDKNTLLDCRFHSSSCNASDFTSVLTRMGKCHTFNADLSSGLHQTIAGFGQGLSFTLNVQHSNYTEEPLYGNQEAGIMFQIHSKYEPPEVHKFGVAVPVGHKAFTIVTRKDSEIMHIPWGKCNPSSQKVLKYFSTYTLSSCMLECYTDHLIAQCGCRTYDQYWATNYANECTPDELLNCTTPYLYEIESKLTPELCQCTIPCSFTEYTAIPSYSTAPSLQSKTLFQTSTGFSSSLIEENFVSVEITFAEIGYEKSIQSKKIDESGLLSDVGGQLGLWVGMSFLTAAEFLQYFIMRAAACIKSIKKKVSSKNKNSVESIN